MAKFNQQLFDEAQRRMRDNGSANERSIDSFVRTALHGEVVNVLEVQRADPLYWRAPAAPLRVEELLHHTTRAFDCRIAEADMMRLQREFGQARVDRHDAERFREHQARAEQAARLREQNPALKNAFEAYQCLLALCADSMPLVRDCIE